MHRFLPKTVNQWLAALAAVALFAGWLTTWWTLGAALGLTILCIVAIRSPHAMLALPWTRKEQSAAPQAAEFKPLAAEPVRPPRPKKPKHSPQESLVDQMVAQGRVALLLRPQIAANLSDADLQKAQEALDHAMAMVPEGQVALRPRCYDLLDRETAERAERLIQVEGLFLDRYTVTNSQYLDFVTAGGYEQMSLWDEALWPAVLTFVDRTGQPGPRFWENGEFADGKEDHPVVGISWYEACAYSRWAGKRLPTDAEWVKAASWPVFAEGARPIQRKFPWGEAMDRRLTNIWGSGLNTTVPVHAHDRGASANGVLQLVGNVWEWTSSSFGSWEPPTRKIETQLPLKSIRGGAFDSYFETQVHTQFQSGENPLARKHNIGFRCAIGYCDVVQTTDARPSHTGDQSTQLEEVSA
jgi:formylglycine-generating enzyme required for sulfatase activity